MGTQFEPLRAPQKGMGAQQPLTYRPIYCGQTAGWIQMLFGMEAGLRPGHIVLDGDPVPLPQRGTAPSPIMDQ